MSCKILKCTEYKELVNLLKNDEVVGFPTETVYGLAIKVNSKIAYQKLMDMKKRENKPFSIMVSNISKISELAYVDDRAKKIINKFMPGAITILLKPKMGIVSYPKIGIRVPLHQLSLDILKEIDEPLFVTSANLSSQPALNDYIDVYNTFKDELSCLISEDAGHSNASTVVDLSENEIKVLRVGTITIEDINKVIQED